MQNQLVITGKIVKIYPDTKTINNLVIKRFVVEHISKQTEAEFRYEVKCRIYCLMVNNQIELTLTDIVKLNGFLNQNAKSQLVLHIRQLDFLEEL